MAITTSCALTSPRWARLYVAGILSTTTVWAPSAGPLPAKTWSGRGRRPKLMRRDDKHRPVSVKALALSLPKRAWRTIEWREGAAEPLRSRFARLRIRAAHRDYWLAEPRPEEWLFIDWPKGETEPTKYFRKTSPLLIWSTRRSCAGGSYTRRRFKSCCTCFSGSRVAILIFTGERGELVLTTLKKRARPMIRFRTGDIVSFNPEPCRCGRTVIRLNGVHGRLDDMLIIKGVNLFPSDVEAVARQDHDLTGEGGRARRPARPAHQTRTLRIAFCANCRQSPASPRK